MSLQGLTILGNNSALPAFDRHPTSQVLYCEDQIILIDCGEGTQIQLARYKIRRSRIRHIFISHLHGDHYFGLIGLITSMSLLGRVEPLHIYGPSLLQEIIEIQLNAANNLLSYPLFFHVNKQPGLVLDEEKFTVHCFPTLHRIPCWGYLFKEKKPVRRVLPIQAKAHNIPPEFFKHLQKGEDYTKPNGEKVSNELVTAPAPPPKSYAFTADTAYDEKLVPLVAKSTVLYHEATYLDDFKDKAISRFHSTAGQAACIAKQAGVDKLLIGHFSSKYEQLNLFLEQAQAVFKDTELAVEGVTYLF